MSPPRLKPEERRIVIKVGSAQLIDPDSGAVRQARFSAIADDIAALKANGHDVVLVSSGAVALGRQKLKFELNDVPLVGKQAFAAIGQPILISQWQRAFARHNLVCAQTLLTPGDTEVRRRWLNARGTMEALFPLGAVPIVNENDTVATEELRFGDNDRLAARVAQLIGAGQLYILSDVDGLYDRPPSEVGATHIPRIAQITAEIEAMGGGAIQSGVGTGGMSSKLAAARIAVAAGCTVTIARGDIGQPIKAIKEGARHSVFEADRTPHRARQAWIRGLMVGDKARLILDEGACKAVRSGASLLPVGVKAVEGEFERGAAVRLVDGQGQGFATGLISYDGREARLIAGAQSGDIESRLGYWRTNVLVHADDLVLDGIRPDSQSQ